MCPLQNPERVLRGELSADPEVAAEATLKLGFVPVEPSRVCVHDEQAAAGSCSLLPYFDSKSPGPGCSTGMNRRYLPLAIQR